MIIEFEDISNIIENQYDLQEVKKGVSKLDEVREIIRNELLKLSQGQLLYRENPDKWNIIEIIRHLALSEDDRINYWILDNGIEPTVLGKPPHFLVNNERYKNVGKTEVEDLEKVFDEWDRIHNTFTECINSISEDDLKTDTSERDLGQGDVGSIIQRMIPHEFDHYNTINRILSEF